MFFAKKSRLTPHFESVRPSRPSVKTPSIALVGILMMVFPHNGFPSPREVITVEAASTAQSARLSALAKQILSRLKKKAFSILPDALSALQSKSKSMASAALIEEYFFAAAVSGLPPTLASFDRRTGLAINTFWRSNVVQSIAVGTPSPEQCGEFFIGQTDGQSGGFGACIMAEGVGRAFETAIDAGKSACQMRNFSTKVKITDKSLTFKRGKKLIPDGDLSKIFNAQEKERLIKIQVRNEEELDDNGNLVRVNPQNIFIRIPSVDSNEKRKFLYRAELFFCEEGVSTAQGYNSIQVLTSGFLKITNKDARFEGSGSSLVSLNGRVRPKGSSLSWELDSPRTGEVRFTGQREGRSINERMGFSVAQDEVIARRYRRGENGGVAKEYSVAAIVGQNAVDLRFLSGAFKNIVGDGRTVVGATEFRDTYYASAPGSELLPRAQNFDFSADELFSDLSDVSVDLSHYRCSLRPDISIVFDRSKAPDDLFDTCETQRLKRMDFCSGSAIVGAARERRPLVCSTP